MGPNLGYYYGILWYPILILWYPMVSFGLWRGGFPCNPCNKPRAINPLQ